VQLKPLDIEPRALFSIFPILPSFKLHFSFYSILFLSPLFFYLMKLICKTQCPWFHRKRRYCLTKLASFLIFDLIFYRYAHYVCSLCDSPGFEVLFFRCLICFLFQFVLCSAPVKQKTEDALPLTLRSYHIEPGTCEKVVSLSLYYLSSKLVYFLLFYFYLSFKIKKIII
jgi:hypothetical protein